jgi:hypothetical protein
MARSQALGFSLSLARYLGMVFAGKNLGFLSIFEKPKERWNDHWRRGADGAAHRDRGPPFDGHLTVMKFTTNWRVGFGTPGDGYGQEVEMSAGKTFADAARTALANPQRVNCIGASQSHQPRGVD